MLLKVYLLCRVRRRTYDVFPTNDYAYLAIGSRSKAKLMETNFI